MDRTPQVWNSKNVNQDHLTSKLQIHNNSNLSHTTPYILDTEPKATNSKSPIYFSVHGYTFNIFKNAGFMMGDYQLILHNLHFISAHLCTDNPLF